MTVVGSKPGHVTGERGADLCHGDVEVRLLIVLRSAKASHSLVYFFHEFLEFFFALFDVQHKECSFMIVASKEAPLVPGQHHCEGLHISSRLSQRRLEGLQLMAAQRKRPREAEMGPVGLGALLFPCVAPAIFPSPTRSPHGKAGFDRQPLRQLPPSVVNGINGEAKQCLCHCEGGVDVRRPVASRVALLFCPTPCKDAGHEPFLQWPKAPQL
mmetsp:Transcript_16099/g.47252  ORF Transcript_16099/g.47252 Transcript_16099/m.47252 type:complete len:213 (+) Transcript_16099:181-819(+)